MWFVSFVLGVRAAWIQLKGGAESDMEMKKEREKHRVSFKPPKHG